MLDADGIDHLLPSVRSNKEKPKQSKDQRKRRAGLDCGDLNNIVACELVEALGIDRAPAPTVKERIPNVRAARKKPAAPTWETALQRLAAKSIQSDTDNLAALRRIAAKSIQSDAERLEELQQEA